MADNWRREAKKNTKETATVGKVFEAGSWIRDRHLLRELRVAAQPAFAQQS